MTTTVLVTGANRGIGLALATAYAERGDTVLACCRDPSRATELRSLAKDHAVQVLPLRVDDAASVAALARELATATVDVLVNNAGVSGGPLDSQTATTVDFDAWAEAFAVNTMGPVRVMQALLPQLQRSRNAKVMSVTSQLGALSLDLALAYGYSATKAALNKFMRLAAIDLKPQGIAVGVIHPGWVKTDLGGPGAQITPAASAAGIVKVIDELTLETTGRFWKWNGSLHDW
jgi:NAD(P)-dependent dehydrogenase (short-subunit alcohol dehydrogenase family)